MYPGSGRVAAQSANSEAKHPSTEASGGKPRLVRSDNWPSVLSSYTASRTGGRDIRGRECILREVIHSSHFSYKLTSTGDEFDRRFAATLTSIQGARSFIISGFCYLFAVCPLKGSTSAHYHKAAAESRAWINGYNIFKGSKLAFFVQGSNELLVSHTYPYADYDQFRTCCDFVNLLFVVDEVSDDQDGQGARHTGEVFLNAMRYTDWDDGSSLAKMTREFKQRLLEYAGPGCYRRFLVHCADYVTAVGREAELREQGEVLDSAAFQTLRRENSAIRLCFGLFEFVLGVDLPDTVFQDKDFMTLYWAAADMVCWSNDVYSYKMEQAKGLTGNNIVTVLMRERGIDLQAASDVIGAHFAELMALFTGTKARLPSFGPAVDAAVAKYVAAMEHWVIGNLEWSFETQRYFGVVHAEVKATRVVVLHPCDNQQ